MDLTVLTDSELLKLYNEKQNDYSAQNVTQMSLKIALNSLD